MRKIWLDWKWLWGRVTQKMFADEQLGMRKHDHREGSECRERFLCVVKYTFCIVNYAFSRIHSSQALHKHPVGCKNTHFCHVMWPNAFERCRKMQQRQENSDRESRSERGSQSVGMQVGGGIWFPWQHAGGWALGVRSSSNCVALHRPSPRLAPSILPHSLSLCSSLFIPPFHLIPLLMCGRHDTTFSSASASPAVNRTLLPCREPALWCRQWRLSVLSHALQPRPKTTPTRPSPPHTPIPHTRSLLIWNASARRHCAATCRRGCCDWEDMKMRAAMIVEHDCCEYFWKTVWWQCHHGWFHCCLATIYICWHNCTATIHVYSLIWICIMKNISKLACGQNLTNGNVFYDCIIFISIKLHTTEPNNKDVICHLDIFRGPNFPLNNVLIC